MAKTYGKEPMQATEDVLAENPNLEKITSKESTITIGLESYYRIIRN